MTIHISEQAEARVIEEARRQGISVEALIEKLINEGIGNGGPSPAATGAALLEVLQASPCSNGGCWWKKVEKLDTRSHNPTSSSPPLRFTTDTPLSLVIARTTTRRMYPCLTRGRTAPEKDGRETNHRSQTEALGSKRRKLKSRNAVFNPWKSTARTTARHERLTSL